MAAIDNKGEVHLRRIDTDYNTVTWRWGQKILRISIGEQTKGKKVVECPLYKLTLNGDIEEQVARFNHIIAEQVGFFKKAPGSDKQVLTDRQVQTVADSLQELEKLIRL